MAGFLDFARGLFSDQGWGAILTPAITSLLAPKPKNSIDPGSLAPLYQAMAANAANQSAFADEQRKFYNERYRPAAIAFGNRASSVGGFQDQMQAAGRTQADYAQALGAQEGAIKRRLGGNPTSGGYGAAMGALKAGAVPGQITAMNNAMLGREAYGDRLKSEAIRNFATVPDYTGGASMYGAAGAGLTNLSNLQNQNWRQEVADVSKAVKLPWDVYDEEKRRQEQDAQLEKILETFKNYRKV